VKKKVLTVCNGGNCRSPALAEVLKGNFSCDAIAIGTYWTQPGTMRMLCEWADIIAPVEPRDAKLPEPDLGFWRASPLWEYSSKIRIARVGPDIWGHAKAEALRAHCRAIAPELLA